MKTIIKPAITILLGIVFSGSIVIAQEQIQSDQPIQGTQMKKPVLTKEQKAMLKNDLQKRKELREAFKSTLTQEQENMLTDPRVMPSDRIKAFRASLTDQQVNMIKTRQQEIKVMKDEFRSTLTADQKMQLRKMAVSRVTMNRALFRHDFTNFRFI
jgi:hypothetical protein